MFSSCPSVQMAVRPHFLVSAILDGIPSNLIGKVGHDNYLSRFW